MCGLNILLCSVVCTSCIVWNVNYWSVVDHPECVLWPEPGFSFIFCSLYCCGLSQSRVGCFMYTDVSGVSEVWVCPPSWMAFQLRYQVHGSQGDTQKNSGLSLCLSVWLSLSVCCTLTLALARLSCKSFSLSFRLWIPQVRGQPDGFFVSIQLDSLHPPRWSSG